MSEFTTHVFDIEKDKKENLNADKIYFSLDEAREEIKKRWNNVELKKAVENELGDNMIPYFTDTPQSVIWRSMLSPDHGFDFYYLCSKYLNCDLTPLEYLQDKFVTINPEKKALSKIRLTSSSGSKKFIEIVDYRNQEGQPLSEIETKMGQSLADFHSGLFKQFYPDVKLNDISVWCKKNGGAKEYYYPYFLHFITHGVLFESFDTEHPEREDSFLKEVFWPSYNKVINKFNLKPLIVRLYPENQDIDEDFFWFTYRNDINNYILNQATTMNLSIKDFK